VKEPRAVPLYAPPNYPFPKGTEGLLSWSHAEALLETAPNYWISTVRPNGRPHATPVWGVWVDGALYLDGNPVTRWARNLAANPAVSVHLESAEDVVILEGTVEDLPAVEGYLAEQIVTAWDGKYGRLHPDPAGRGIFRLMPLRARGWSTSTLRDGTRWEFVD
jgi:pyridoxamine 5'-phosphate oxidase-like protein